MYFQIGFVSVVDSTDGIPGISKTQYSSEVLPRQMKFTIQFIQSDFLVFKIIDYALSSAKVIVEVLAHAFKRRLNI